MKIEAKYDKYKMTLTFEYVDVANDIGTIVVHDPMNKKTYCFTCLTTLQDRVRK